MSYVLQAEVKLGTVEAWWAQTEGRLRAVSGGATQQQSTSARSTMLQQALVLWQSAMQTFWFHVSDCIHESNAHVSTPLSTTLKETVDLGLDCAMCWSC